RRVLLQRADPLEWNGGTDDRPVALAVEVDGGWEQGGVLPQGQGGRSGREQGPLTEEVDLHSPTLDVAVAEEGDDAVCSQGAKDSHSGPGVERDDAQAGVAAEVQEPLEQLLRFQHLGDDGKRADVVDQPRA